MKYNTQNDRIAAITEKILAIGIDVGSETHYARAFDNKAFEYSEKPLEFKNDEAGFKLLQAWITVSCANIVLSQMTRTLNDSEPLAGCLRFSAAVSGAMALTALDYPP